MRKSFLTILILCLLIGLSAQAKVSSMTDPQITFNLYPMTLISQNYYDYQFGAYSGNPMQLQPTTLNLYLSFMHKATITGRRGVFFTYVDQNVATPQYYGGISSAVSNEGFVTLGIDQETQNPFFAWHAQYNAVDNNGTADAFLNIYLAADNYSVLSTPGSPFERIKVINNESAEFEYIWPNVYLGPSPQANMRRIYVFAMNSGSKPTTATPSSNVKLAYADYNSDLFDGADLDLNWQYRTFTYLDAIHESPLNTRAYPSYFVKDNKVIIGGFAEASKGISAADDSTNIIYPPHNVFYLVNDNYGEGDFTVYTFDTNRSVPNPTNQGGVPDGTGYTDFEVQDSYASHKNLVFDNYNKIHTVGNYVTTFLEVAGASEDERKYWPNTQSVKDLIFDLDTHELKISDLYPKSSDPYDNIVFPVWDLNEDDAPDSYDTDGNWEFAYKCVPIPFHNSTNFFHNNYFRQTNASPQGWMVALWSDCTKSYAYNVSQDDDYADYAEIPEIAMVFSRDNGVTWSDVLYLNSTNTPELQGMIPSFSYLAPDIQVINSTTGRVHWMFMDDNSFGSYIYNDGANTGGNVCYTSFDVDFSQFTGINDEVVINSPKVLRQNYPNPFNPNTNIVFELKNPETLSLVIYNVKGQLVKSLAKGHFSAGPHTFSWNGLDENNKSVASGVYFYKLTGSKHNEMRKMLLVK